MLAGMATSCRKLALAFASIVAPVAGAAACNALADIEAATLRNADAAIGDAAPDSDASEACTVDDAGTSQGCSSSAPVCSHGACASITALAKGGAPRHSFPVLPTRRVRSWYPDNPAQ